MHKTDGLSATHEMYLKIIYQLRESGDPARVGQMAKGLGVHPSTVSAVVRTLAKNGLVTHDRYGVVKLTDVGERLAECVVHRFRTLRRFFMEVLGLEEDVAEVEACEIEHAASPLTISRIAKLVDDMQRQGYRQQGETVESELEMCAECVLAGECTAAQAVLQEHKSPATQN